MTYLENQVPEPPSHLEETWTRTSDPSGLAGSIVLALVRPQGEIEALYKRYDTDRCDLCEIEESGDLESLENFDMSNCKSLERLLDLSNMMKLKGTKRIFWVKPTSSIQKTKGDISPPDNSCNEQGSLGRLWI
ncbi:hypothetical protein LguiB_013186 [Lonicera macranthoides]